MSKYSTEIDVDLTDEECKLVDSLQSLANKWKKHGKRLWLFSAAGSLTVMLEGDSKTNPEPTIADNKSVNKNNCITIISGIRNDGGDW